MLLAGVAAVGVRSSAAGSACRMFVADRRRRGDRGRSCFAVSLRTRLCPGAGTGAGVACALSGLPRHAPFHRAAARVRAADRPNRLSSSSATPRGRRTPVLGLAVLCPALISGGSASGVGAAREPPEVGGQYEGLRVLVDQAGSSRRRRAQTRDVERAAEAGARAGLAEIQRRATYFPDWRERVSLGHPRRNRPRSDRRSGRSSRCAGRSDWYHTRSGPGESATSITVVGGGRADIGVPGPSPTPSTKYFDHLTGCSDFLRAARRCRLFARLQPFPDLSRAHATRSGPPGMDAAGRASANFRHSVYGPSPALLRQRTRHDRRSAAETLARPGTRDPNSGCVRRPRASATTSTTSCSSPSPTTIIFLHRTMDPARREPRSRAPDRTIGELVDAGGASTRSSRITAVILMAKDHSQIAVEHRDPGSSRPSRACASSSPNDPSRSVAELALCPGAQLGDALSARRDRETPAGVSGTLDRVRGLEGSSWSL
jgi:hypothetical protein